MASLAELPVVTRPPTLGPVLTPRSAELMAPLLVVQPQKGVQKTQKTQKVQKVQKIEKIQKPVQQSAKKPVAEDVLLPSWFNTAKLGDIWTSATTGLTRLRSLKAYAPENSRAPLVLLGFALVAVLAGSLFARTAALGILSASAVVVLSAQLK